MPMFEAIEAGSDALARTRRNLALAAREEERMAKKALTPTSAPEAPARRARSR